MSHLRNRDLRVMTLADMVSRLTSSPSFVGQILLLVNLPLYLAGAAHVPWLAVLVLLFAPGVSALMQLALSRSRELDADLGAFGLTGDAVGLASALEKMERYQGSLFDAFVLPGRRVPDPSILRTHPNTEERIARLLDLAGERGAPHGSAPASIPLTSFALPEALPRVHRAPRWHLMGLWH